MILFINPFDPKIFRNFVAEFSDFQMKSFPTRIRNRSSNEFPAECPMSVTTTKRKHDSSSLL